MDKLQKQSSEIEDRNREKEININRLYEQIRIRDKQIG